VNETIPPTEPNQTEEALRLVLVDQSRDAHDEARDAADARLDQELGEGGRAKRFLNGIWKGNVAKDFYRQKYVNQALESIQDSNSIMADAPAERRTRAVEATIERFQSDFDEVIHTDAGESREVQAEDSQLTRGIKKIIHNFVEGNLDAASLQEERTRFLIEYRKQHGSESLGQGIVTTDNLLQIAQTVAGAVEHGESLDNALGKLQVITGEARNGARTEARYSAPDKAVDWLSKRGIASFITPGALAVGAAAAGSIARAGSHFVVGAVTRTILPGAAAAGWAGLREHKRTKDERSQHAREMAVGGQFEGGDKRRVEMDAVSYESISAVDLIGHLKEVGDSERVTSGSSEAVQAALDALAAIQARVQMSDKEKIDLISYSKKADVGEERMMLDLARREVRLALEAGLTNDIRTNLAIDHDKDVSEVIQERADWFAEGLEEEMSDKDAAFNKLKRHRVAKAAAIGLATGVLGGLIVQEAVAAVDSTRFGLIDTIRGESAVPNSDGTVHHTILEGMVRGDESTVHTDASTSYESYTTGTTGSLELSDDHTLITNEDGTSSLVDANGNASVEGLVFEENGTLDRESIDKLYAAGVTIEDTTSLEVVTESVNQDVSTEQYLQNHLSESTHVKRDFWFGNNTPNIYDENELRVYRGGSAEAPGIVDGGYQYSIAGMSPEGSYQGPESVDWNQASANGNLFVAISGTLDGQGQPFMVPIGPDGSVNISADSPAGKFFSNENNAVSFNGAYMEVVQTSGQDADGTVHVRPLATVIGGNNVETITDTVTTEIPVNYPHYTLTTNGFDTVQSNFTEMAPITPVASRRSLEALAIERRSNRGYYYGNEGLNNEEREKIASEASPRLRDNPDAELNSGEELDWYEGELRRRKGDDYVQEIINFVDNDPVMRSISNSTESLVTIPVAAAYEADNIYGTLSLYAQQDPEGVDKTAILLNVNWLDTALDNPDNLAAMQKTVAEIERARQDFPNLKIAVMQKEYNEATVNKSDGVIGYVADDLVNVALLGSRRRIATGEMDSAHDLLVVRGDADAKGMSRTQLRNYQRAAAGDKNLDIVKGTTRFGAEDSVRFPGYGIATTIMTSFQILETQNNYVHTGGANFAIRTSTLAAIGGLGDVSEYSGPGSDDVNIGTRVSVLRDTERPQPSSNSYSGAYAGYGSTTSGGAVKRIKLVSGATADTSGDRLLAAYLSDENPHSVWNSGDKKSFSNGPGGYRSRTEDSEIVNSASPDSTAENRIYESIERVLTFEIRRHGHVPALNRKALAILFGSTPAAYTVTHGSDGEVFTLTDAGREFVKNRVERETDGRFGSYGTRKMRQLYGQTKPGASRQPASAMPPLVSPLA
jgi:hypothetical protein